MTGREIIDGMVRGDIPLPSVAGLLGMRAGDYGDGRASVVMPAAPEQGNAAATMHGGIVATLLDSAMFFAYVTTLGEGQFATTLQMNVQYLRPVPLDGGE
ncbi:MAG TPA: PaaI family thioesterase, partial [Capillimicrobium sp.]